MIESDAEKYAAFIDAVEASLGSMVPSDLYTLARRGAEMQEGMVLVPRTPTYGMLLSGEGITDFVMAHGDNDRDTRILEMRAAWFEMIEQWEREAAILPSPPEGGEA